MENNKQTIHFDFELFQGYTCIGCAVINDLAMEVEFTDDEVAMMKQLVSQIDETDYSKGIMPCSRMQPLNSTSASMLKHVPRSSISMLKTASVRDTSSSKTMSSVATSSRITALPKRTLMKTSTTTGTMKRWIVSVAADSNGFVPAIPSTIRSVWKNIPTTPSIFLSISFQNNFYPSNLWRFEGKCLHLQMRYT